MEDSDRVLLPSSPAVLASPSEAPERRLRMSVLALLSDSTNATVPGRTPSERAVIPAFQEIFAEAKARIIVAAFASSIHRLQIVLDTAQQFDRNCDHSIREQESLALAICDALKRQMDCVAAGGLRLPQWL